MDTPSGEKEKSMRYIGLKWTVLLASVAATAVGCCEKEKEQIQVLYSEKQDLLAQTQELRSQLARAKGDQADLYTQLDAKDLQLKQAQDDLDNCRSKLAALQSPQEPTRQGTNATASGWERTAYGDRVTVGSDILFSAGRASLTTAGKTALNKIAADLKGTYAGLPVRVYGYTDSDPIRKTKNLWKDNLDLSANRAMAITRQLQSMGISAEQIETIAMGETNPVASNATKAGKAKNRRVEIIVIRNR